ncbi:DNA polymerase delta subunit 3-like isoform X1 [Sphaeramia orbicularis]|uniref:DNA polymerase delta subunit 3 n=1 Tax=Sphaeramia orbicularis TaxID=375764 RepID=A0A673A6K6_9TELE|nr:DNA polymerase delta subunit 3-like isoform X1 [Sphaeramia orbicularis]
MDELYLDNIDEYVNDHNKIVTYKWLSLTLGVHVNTAKQMLYHYLDHKRKESGAQLHATYLVSGKFVDNGQTSHKVSVVREEQLEDFKSKMNLVVSVHVYSVQKALLKDSGPLYSVDYDAVRENLKTCSRYSAIRCPSAVPMSSLELQQVREQQQISTSHHENKKPTTNGDTSLTSKPSTKAPKGIMGMFSNKPAQKNHDGSAEVKADPPVVDAPKSKPAAKANPMMNFFGNQTTKKPDKPVKEEEPIPPASTKQQQHSSSKTAEKQEAAAVESPKDVKADSRSKTKRIQDSDSEEERMEKKKRRRIKRPEPDSSDEDVIPDSPQQTDTRQASKSPEKEAESAARPQQDCTGGKVRKRRRVLKSRTFVDDEGCIVTEKGYESESYSEAEDDVQTSKQTPKAPTPPKVSNKEEEKKSQKKSNASKGTKQASIMGFFQKK